MEKKNVISNEGSKTKKKQTRTRKEGQIFQDEESGIEKILMFWRKKKVFCTTEDTVPQVMLWICIRKCCERVGREKGLNVEVADTSVQAI